MRTSQTRVRVRYAETDQMGVVYYANYLVWMEVGRVEYCKTAGFDYRDMENEDGLMLAVAEARCRYSFPARFDDEVVVKTWVREASPRMVTFGYEMRLAADGKKVASGETRHIVCNRDLKPCRLPEKYLAKFGLTPAGAMPEPAA
jgi:acyl-CoA thioester hydrolase